MTDLAKLPLWRSSNLSAWREALDGYDQAIAALANRKLPEHDQWYRHELPAVMAARSPGYVTHDEMVRITEWKMLRGVWRAPNLVLVKNNPPGAVEDATRTASALLDTPPKALAAVVTLGGVGPATASAVLAVMMPERFPFFDEIVTGQVAPHVDGMGQIAWTAVYYRKYALALIQRAVALGEGWHATMVERALWAHGVNAGARV
ncbi:hypothetical protein [Gemmatimonas phototrophica]|uniref:Uncharacterized protein n=1 Tax=Gemmatimonas phototrophica TaxID=1379270 RepID=A0A143BMS6_9BACT|nr:hypothetical protein [Gemmatimonas phototrophica]AMW05913.1 hypothetical protein GEMMAAP_16180 [Gemmatimonas phototrophica]